MVQSDGETTRTQTLLLLSSSSLWSFLSLVFLLHCSTNPRMFNMARRKRFRTSTMEVPSTTTLKEQVDTLILEFIRSQRRPVSVPDILEGVRFKVADAFKSGAIRRSLARLLSVNLVRRFRDDRNEWWMLAPPREARVRG